ncbi:hypothetical protein G7Y89_g15187 [Cudoniella acicularis]|uniref:Uncharacterized protein n=1 Tax=Cudoniella acicularis TaxID=354080 RepID=A0A8H4QRS0_9HELO|nr:hypothetical protein G7Y89_g15187 [Cudoniella acicularis]
MKSIQGNGVPVSNQPAPGKQHQMVGPDAVNDQLPIGEGGYQPYRAAGKLQGKKALITGGDSGIGRRRFNNRLHAGRGEGCTRDEEIGKEEGKRSVLDPSGFEEPSGMQ